MNTEIKRELEMLHSGLAKFDNSKIYKPADSYFDKMQHSVLSKIEGKGLGRNNIIKLRWMMGIAAAFIFIIAVSFLINNQSNTKDTLSTEEVYEYFEENVDYLDDEAIAGIANDNELNFDDLFYSDSDELNEYIGEEIDDITEDELEQIF